MNNNEYLELIEKYPELTTHGFGVETQYEELPYDELFEVKRQELKDAYQEFLYCCKWIEANPDFDGKRIAYHWKHEVENWLQKDHIKPDYIGQGVFILAAIHMGYPIRRSPQSTGARFGKKDVAA